MREGLINIPKCDNDGASLEHVLQDVVLGAAKRFGGATINEARGLWLGPDGKLYAEPIYQVIVAYDETDTSGNDWLAQTAYKAGVQAKQLAMYVRFASGEVEIISIEQVEKAA